MFMTQRAVLLLTMGLLLPAPAHGQRVDTEAWLSDFAVLRAAMAVQYANLDWAIQVRGLDPATLVRETETRLREATTEAEARWAIGAFLAEFGDGHVGVSWPSSGRAAPVADDDAGVSPLCADLGYRPPRLDPGLRFETVPTFDPVAGAEARYFPGGILTLPNGSRVGVLRIEIFGEYAFPELCMEAAANLGLDPGDPCPNCAPRIERRAGNRLTATLATRVEALRGEGMDVLLVDVTGNPGGTGWVEPAARTLAPAGLRSPRIGFIRHPHWVRQLGDRLDFIEQALAEGSSPRETLERAAAALGRARDEAAVPCDRSGLWEGSTPACSLLVTDADLYASGPIAWAAPGQLPDQASSHFLFSPSRYVYREGVYAGPLFVVADRGTASSGEYFVAMLSDNGAAGILGEPTYGAGCGYTGGGIPLVLPHSGGSVSMPDCARFRADGTNEVGGIVPDILVPWRTNDTAYQRAARVVEALGRIECLVGCR